MDDVHRLDEIVILIQFDCSNSHISESQDMATCRSHKFERTDILLLQKQVKSYILNNKITKRRTDAQDTSIT